MPVELLRGRSLPGIKSCLKVCLALIVVIQGFLMILPSGLDKQRADSSPGSRALKGVDREQSLLKQDLSGGLVGFQHEMSRDETFLKNIGRQRVLQQKDYNGKDSDYYLQKPDEGAADSSLQNDTDHAPNLAGGNTSPKMSHQHEALKEAVGNASNGKGVAQQHIPSKPLCPHLPPHLVGHTEFDINVSPPTLEETAVNNANVFLGGTYIPPDCTARYRVAIIVPHRDRDLHLRSLMASLHPILQRQQIRYRIFVVHQAGNKIFNKAKIMNAGFLESLKLDIFDCVIFHDVDLLPEDDRLMYTCDNAPKHLSVAIDKYEYELPYTSIFGGVTVFTPDQFRDVNGFSNEYWGWGGEDDDMFSRVFARGYTIVRPPLKLARYKMSKHGPDKGNRVNLFRHVVLSGAVERMQRDGLSNIKYEVELISLHPLYTNITINVGSTEVVCRSDLSYWTCKVAFWLCSLFGKACFVFKNVDTEAPSGAPTFTKMKVGKPSTDHERNLILVR